MKNHLAARGLLALTSLMLCASFILAEAPKKKKSPLQGTWKHADGNEVVRQVKFDGNKFEVTIEMDGNTAVVKGTFKLHPKKDPKAIDMKVTDDPDGRFTGKTSLGIYKLKDGKLTWCASEPGVTDRPTEFAQQSGDKNFMLVTLKKE